MNKFKILKLVTCISLEISSPWKLRFSLICSCALPEELITICVRSMTEQVGDYQLRKIKERDDTTIYTGENVHSSDKVTIVCYSLSSPESAATFNNELIMAARCFSHSYKTKMRQAFQQNGLGFVVYPKVTRTLQDIRMESGGVLPENRARELFIQVLHAVNELHSSGIAHLNLTAENIYVDDDGSVKLFDYGLAEHFQESQYCMKQLDTNRAYHSPELSLATGFFPHLVDSWCAGIVLALLLLGKFPFPVRSDTMEDPFDVDTMCLLSPRISVACSSFLSELLEPIASSRMTIKEALAHPWITGKSPKVLRKTAVRNLVKNLVKSNRSQSL